MLQINPSPRYIKDRLVCAKKEGWDLDKLDRIVEIMSMRQFTPEEVKIHKIHKLDGKNSKFWELHIINKAHDWVLKYYIKNGILHLERTGSHDTALRAATEIDDDNELIWL